MDHIDSYTFTKNVLIGHIIWPIYNAIYNAGLGPEKGRSTTLVLLNFLLHKTNT